MKDDRCLSDLLSTAGPSSAQPSVAPLTLGWPVWMLGDLRAVTAAEPAARSDGSTDLLECDGAVGRPLLRRSEAAEARIEVVL